MKKIYNFLAMFLLLFAAGASPALAQVSDVTWDIDTENPVTEIQTGTNYAIKHGTYAQWHPDQYLSASGAGITTPDETCIYQFEEDGTVDNDGETFTVYVLRSVYNGQYVSGNNAYTMARSEALHFTACVATNGFTSEDQWNTWTTAQKRAGFNAERQAGSEGVTMIFALAEVDDDGTVNFLCYWGNPAVSSYQDTNAWFVYNATQRAKTNYEKMNEAYEALFPSGWSETAFTVGTTPGCVSQEVYDQLEAAFLAYSDALGGADLPSEDVCLEVYNMLVAASEALANGRVQVTPGYYIMKSQRSQDAAYDDGANVRCTANYTIPETLTAADARYIWQVVDAGNDRYQLKNVKTGRFVNAGTGTSVIFTTSEESTATFTFPWLQGTLFRIQDQNGNFGHCDGSMQFVQWNSTGEGNQWAFTPVSQDVIDAMLPEIEHNQLLASLADLVSEAQSASVNYLYDSDVTFDDQYASAGLVDAAHMSTNAPEPNEGYDVANQFVRLTDGNLQTYFHTRWSGGDDAPTSGYHWVQVDLGEAVQNLFIKFSDRHNNRNNTPRRLALVAPADGEDPASAVWTDTLLRDTIIYQYTTHFTNAALDSTTAVLRVDLGKPVQNLRFVVTRTAHPSGGMANGSGPFWNLSELRFYTDGGDNPLYLMIPEEVRNALSAQLEVASAALADSSATQETYDALEAALEAFYDAYPDPTALNNRLETARTLLEGAEEGDDYGYFQSGAIAEYQTALNAIETEIEGQNLTLTQLDEYMDRVNAAMDAFNARLNVPEDGVYFIRSTTEAAAADNYVYATNAGENGTTRWGYAAAEDLSSRLETMWYLQHKDDGTVSLRNLATGRYITNLYKGTEEPDTIDLSQSLPLGGDADGVSLVFSGTPGSFNFEFASGYYMNADPSGPVVNWSAAGGNSNFTFEVVDMFDGIQTVDITPNAVQILSLPFSTDPSWASAPIYRVLGQKADANGQNYLQLEAWPDNEPIPAGEAFIISETDGQSTFMAGLYSFDAVEFATTTEYAYDPVTVKGLVSAITEVVPKAGEGLLLDNKVMISDGTRQVDAGTGYFNDQIPVVEQDGDAELLIDGVINAVGGVQIVDNAENVDVYTLSGVKLRSNVKAANATNGLPAGLYIVGGKKVLVK